MLQRARAEELAELAGWSVERAAGFLAGQADPQREVADPRDEGDEYPWEPGLDADARWRLGFCEGAEECLLPDDDMRSATRERLIQIAKGWEQGWDEDEVFPAEEGDWRYEPDYPVEKLLRLMSREQWREWFRDENAGARDDGRDGYGNLVAERINEPLVISEDADGDVQHIWDGWHRSGAAVVKGADTIRVIVGVRRPEYLPKVPR